MNLKFATKPNMLDIVIDEALAQLSGVDINTDEYALKVDQITKLYKLKEQQAPKRVSPDALVSTLGSLFGILLIIRHEQVNVITSKALGFVTRSR